MCRSLEAVVGIVSLAHHLYFERTQWLQIWLRLGARYKGREHSSRDEYVPWWRTPAALVGVTTLIVQCMPRCGMEGSLARHIHRLWRYIRRWNRHGDSDCRSFVMACQGTWSCPSWAGCVYVKGVARKTGKQHSSTHFRNGLFYSRILCIRTWGKESTADKNISEKLKSILIRTSPVTWASVRRDGLTFPRSKLPQGIYCSWSVCDGL